MDRRDDTRMVKVFRSKDGGPIKSTKPKKPAGMSGRQFRNQRKAARRAMKAVLNGTAEA